MKISAKTVCGVTALVLCAAAVAAAQPAPPPPVGNINKPPTMLYYFVGFVLLAGTVVLSILPAKRRDND